MRVKICGITRPEDALCAEQAGADAIGLIFAGQSKRLVTLKQAAAISAAVGPLLTRVGVFVDAPLDFVLEAVAKLKLHAVQLHGQEDAAYARQLSPRVNVIKAVSFRPNLEVAVLKCFPAEAILLDGLKPGSGESFDWTQAASFKNFPRLILAGGLNPVNVAAGIAALKPYAVDVSSGVESSPGIKDSGKIQDFVRAVKQAELSTVIHSQAKTCG